MTLLYNTYYNMVFKIELSQYKSSNCEKTASKPTSKCKYSDDIVQILKYIKNREKRIDKKISDKIRQKNDQVGDELLIYRH